MAQFAMMVTKVDECNETTAHPMYRMAISANLDYADELKITVRYKSSLVSLENGFPGHGFPGHGFP
jgi:hypothetical protein